jgi:ATP-dependent DNA helicase RecG
MVLSYIRQHGQIKRAEVMDLCRLTEGQTKALLRRLVESQKIALQGIGKASKYSEFVQPSQV